MNNNSSNFRTLVHLNHLRGFQWEHCGQTIVAGYAHIRGTYLNARGLVDHLESYTPSELEALLPELYGQFAIVRNDGEYLWVAMDCVRSIPLFYGRWQSTLIVSDSADYVRECLQCATIPSRRAAELLNARMVTGNDTLFPGVHQLSAGEYLEFNSEGAGHLRQERYFNFIRDEVNEDREEHLTEQLDEVHLGVFRRLIESLEGRTAVVPLSGGEDSRLIAWMLSRLGYDNVQLITYGPKGNWEAEIAEQVADCLGYPWQFISTTHRKWNYWFNHPERKKLTTYADKLSVLPHLQDYPVFAELFSEGKIPEDSVIIPGHTGDLLTGNFTPGHVVQKDDIESEQLLQKILKRHYSVWDINEIEDEYLEFFKQKILDKLRPREKLKGAEFCDLSEFWEWQERSGKFLMNSLCNYEYFGYQWRLPLWDQELVRFWRSVPAHLRADRYLFKRYVRSHQNLPVKKANSSRLKKWNYFKNPLANTRYGRFGGRSAYLKKIKHITTPLPFHFIHPERRLIFNSIGGLSGLVYLNEILERTGARIDFSSPE